MTPEELDHLFTYHQPTEEQEPMYAAVRAATTHVSLIIRAPESYELVNERCKMFAACLLEVCPPSADRSAALRCIRLVRNALNESFSHIPTDTTYKACLRMAADELMKARWQACSSIALHNPNNEKTS